MQGSVGRRAVAADRGGRHAAGRIDFNIYKHVARTVTLVGRNGQTHGLALSSSIRKFTLHPTAMRPIAEAIITRGGVSVKEVNPNTMESKLVKGLYFAGELLDVDAYTGGYNLQIAFATGFAAGSAI